MENIEVQVENPVTGVEMDEVFATGQSVENVLNNPDWVEDATYVNLNALFNQTITLCSFSCLLCRGLAPHCLAILKTCHMLSDKLVGMTVQSNNTELCSPETMTDLVATARRISPRVDDVVKSLYPPLDPRLLEAR